MNWLKMLAAVVGVVAMGFAHGATYTNEVAAGVTQTFAQMESALGITLAADDTIVKKGPGTLQVTKDDKYKIKYTMIVEEGVFDVPDGVTNNQKGRVTVKKGGCLSFTTAVWRLRNGRLTSKVREREWRRISVRW